MVKLKAAKDAMIDTVAPARAEAVEEPVAVKAIDTVQLRKYVEPVGAALRASHFLAYGGFGVHCGHEAGELSFVSHPF
jgi:hypothetical protein